MASFPIRSEDWIHRRSCVPYDVFAYESQCTLWPRIGVRNGGRQYHGCSVWLLTDHESKSLLTGVVRYDLTPDIVMCGGKLSSKLSSQWRSLSLPLRSVSAPPHSGKITSKIPRSSVFKEQTLSLVDTDNDTHSCGNDRFVTRSTNRRHAEGELYFGKLGLTLTLTSPSPSINYMMVWSRSTGKRPRIECTSSAWELQEATGSLCRRLHWSFKFLPPETKNREREQQGFLIEWISHVKTGR